MPGDWLLDTIGAGERFLLERQCDDGVWRDYALAPGASEAWVTAWTIYVLARPPLVLQSASALAAGADALHALRVEGGWGYNRRTAPDADSTAWSCRALTTLDDRRGLDLLPVLSRYVREDGVATTFVGAHRFGLWAGGHTEVTPLVGMAAYELGGANSTVERIRRACVRCVTDSGWPSFWWSEPAYAIARNVEFLSVSGGIPPELARNLGAAETQGHAHSAFGLANEALLAAHSGGHAYSDMALRSLLEMQRSDGGWPSSETLLVRGQDTATATTRHRDHRRVITTAAALEAVKVFACQCSLQPAAE